MKKEKLSLAQLAELLRAVGVNVEMIGDDVLVDGCACDSRDVTAGNLFVCKGRAFAPRFLTSAKEAGAHSYLCVRELHEALAQTEPDMPCLVVPQEDLRAAMAHASRIAFHEPDLAKPVLGVTGTKGKSSVAYFVRSIFSSEPDAKDFGVMGSIDTYDGIEKFESHNTTPEAPELWRHLAHVRDSQAAGMIMEVSSQGLKYDRTLGLHLEVGAFLNIGRDHISPIEHPDFEDYFASKLRIFAQSKNALVNLGTDQVERVLEAAKASEHLYTYSDQGPDAIAGATPDFYATDVSSRAGRICFTAHTPQWTNTVELGIPGLFNVENALAAIGIAQLAGANEEQIIEGLRIARVPGRMELIGSDDDQVLCLVDYAHNKLSYERLFSSLKEEFPHRRIVALFGCPGDKAQERRRELPQEAAKWSDLLIYTEEDPAHEEVADICAEMAANTPEDARYEVICDREEAIEFAVRDALSHEQPTLLALLAKGDETRQHRGDEFPEVLPDGTIYQRAMEQFAGKGEQ